MKKGFFNDADGNFSMMRLIVFIVVVASTFCFVLEVVYSMINKNYENHLLQIISFATLGFGAKWAQKQTEKK